MPVVHIVMFAFKASTSQGVIDTACKRMTGLSTECIHPQSKQNYFKSYGGGRNNSPEGHAKGLSHGFVCEFENEKDRDYYLNEDPAHLAFVASVKDILQDVCVLDYGPGVY